MPLNTAIIASIVTGSVVVTAAVVITISVVLTSSDKNAGGYGSSDDSMSSYDSSMSGGSRYIPQPIKNNPYMTNEMDSFEILSTTKYNGEKPKEWQMKYTKYPYWQSGLSFTNEEKQNIINENKEYMENLLKHAADGTLGRMPEKYGGERQFEATGVNWEADRLKVRYGLFGGTSGQRAVAWAFPGEIVTVEFPKDTNYNGIMLSIGKCNHNPSDQWLIHTGIWSNNRMPYDSIGFNLASNRQYIVNDTIKFGSPFGGMIYLRLDRSFSNALYVNFTNVGRAPIVMYNITTNEEWNRELRNAPGNVAEIRTPGNRFAFTARQIRGVEDVQYVADYWYKAIAVSEHTVTQVNKPISMHFDERVDAGAAVSYVGRWFTQHPSGWAWDCVNKNGLLNSASAWGPIHEMNHQMQGWGGGLWGMGDPTEETNNALTAITYMLYTNVAGQRHNGLGGWACVADGYYNIKSIMNGDYNQNHLKSYVNILHAFGPDTLTKLIRSYYGSWHNKNYANIYGIGRNSESAFCLLAAEAMERDSRYFCSLFNYKIKDNVSEAIANMHYPVYYPFFNLYCMSYNGHKYGRPYKLTYGVANRLNFKTTTAIDRKITDAVYTIKSGLTKGKLVMVEESVYDYTPLFGAGESDSFVLSIDCTVNGTKVHIEQEGMFYVNTHVAIYDTYKDINANNLDTAINISNSMNATVTNRASSSLGIGKYNDGTSKSLSKMRGKLIFPETGYYTLFMRPDDMGRFLLKIDEEYEQLIEFNTYIGSYSRTNNKTFYTLMLEGGKEYPFILYNLNTGGPGEIHMGYCYHGDNASNINVATCRVSEIGSNLIYHEKAKLGPEPEFVVPEIVYQRPTRFLTNDYRTSPYCSDRNATTCYAKCLALPERAGNEPGGQCIDIFDDSTGTFHHTPWTKSTQFPVNYSFAFDEAITFNKVYVHHRRDIDSWGYFEMYVRSLETGEMELVGTNHHSRNVETHFLLPDLIKTDRVEFKVFNNSANNRYVVVSSVVFSISGGSFMNFTNSFGPDITSNGFKNVVAPGASGGYLTVNEKAGEGSLCFKFKGSKFGLYGIRRPTSGKFRITIDDVEVERASQSYFHDSERTLFFTYKFDEAEAEKVHNVCMEVVEGYVNLDVIGSS